MDELIKLINESADEIEHLEGCLNECERVSSKLPDQLREMVQKLEGKVIYEP